MRARALLLASGLALSACAGPRAPVPPGAAVVAPVAWRNAFAGQGSVNAAWWRSFEDPTLSDLVERALAGNVDVDVAAARVEEARAQLRLASADLLPRIDAGVTGLRQRDIGPFGTARVQIAAQPLLLASYDVDLFGRFRAASAAARANLLATADARDAVRLAVASTTAAAYISLRALDARLEVARQTIVDREAALHVASRRARSGYSSMLEMRQAEAEYRATTQLVPQLELAIARQENALRVLVGSVPGDVERGAAIDRMVVPMVPAGLPAEVLRRRPDIAQAEHLLVAADRSLDSARAAFLPSLRLTGSGGVAVSSLLGDPISLWSLGASVLAPLFEGGRLRAQSDTASARRDQAAFAYRRAALQAFREVEDGLAYATRSREQLEELRAQHDALAAALRLATERYEAGYAPYLDQLDAQRGLLNAELDVIQSKADRLLAAVALFQAVGGGWSDAGRGGMSSVAGESIPSGAVAVDPVGTETEKAKRSVAR